MNETTTIAPEIEPLPRKKRSKKRGGLFVTDAELIERLNVPEKIARAAIDTLDADRASGFPQKQALWGDRRLFSAVKKYLKKTCTPAFHRQEVDTVSQRGLHRGHDNRRSPQNAANGLR